MPPEDEVALVDAVLHAVENPKRLIAHGERGRRFVLEHFDRDKLARDYLKVLHALIEGEDLPRFKTYYS